MRKKIIENYQMSITMHQINVLRKRKAMKEFKELFGAYELHQKEIEITEEEQLIKDLEQQLEYIKEHLN